MFHPEGNEALAQLPREAVDTPSLEVPKIGWGFGQADLMCGNQPMAWRMELNGL